MVFDFHTHVFPETIAAATLRKLGAAADIPPFTDGTETGLLRSMQAAGIDRALVLPVATNPLKVAKLNDVSAALNGKNGVFYAGAMHPLCPEMKAELRRIKALGLKGIKIHPVYQGVDLDAPPFLTLLYEAAALGLFVVTHAGDDIGFPGVVHCSPEMAANALRQVGNVKLILAHTGGWMNWERVPDLAEYPSAMIDVSFSLGKVRRASGAPPLRLLDAARMAQIIRAFGAERVLFGSDSPWGDQKAAVEAVRALPLSPEETAQILWENAERLMGAV